MAKPLQNPCMARGYPWHSLDVLDSEKSGLMGFVKEFLNLVPFLLDLALFFFEKFVVRE
jgi:hypothetical protein